MLLNVVHYNNTSARCVWLACLAVVVGLGPNRGLTVVFLGKTSTTTTKVVFLVKHQQQQKNSPNEPGGRARLFFLFIYLFISFILLIEFNYVTYVSYPLV